MSFKTKIQWTDATGNPWRGCSKVSPGCKHCYAEALNNRFYKGQNWGQGTPRPRVESFERQMLAWNRQAQRQGKPIKVFPSMIDWLDKDVPIEQFADFLDIVRRCEFLIFQLLTKRPELWHERIHECQDFCERNETEKYDALFLYCLAWLSASKPCSSLYGQHPENIWVGVSVENQELADKRIPLLQNIPAKIRFLSCEPLLGPINLRSSYICDDKIDWVIIGGESGPGARPCSIAWIRGIRNFCRTAKCPVFVKELGAKPCEGPDDDLCWVKLRDSKGGDDAEWPEDLQNCREFPIIL